MLKAYESYNPPHTLPPAQAEIIGLYATVTNPYTHQPQAVRILFSYMANTPPLQGEESFQAVMVCGLYPQSCAYSVRRAALRHIQVFAILGGR